MVRKVAWLVVIVGWVGAGEARAATPARTALCGAEAHTVVSGRRKRHKKPRRGGHRRGKRDAPKPAAAPKAPKGVEF